MNSFHPLTTLSCRSSYCFHFTDGKTKARRGHKLVTGKVRPQTQPCGSRVRALNPLSRCPSGKSWEACIPIFIRKGVSNTYYAACRLLGPRTGTVRAYRFAEERSKSALKRKLGKIGKHFPYYQCTDQTSFRHPRPAGSKALALLMFTSVTFLALPLPPSMRQREHQNFLTEGTLRDVTIFHDVHLININNHATTTLPLWDILMSQGSFIIFFFFFFNHTCSSFLLK